MMQNLVMGEALQVFEQKARERVLETNANYELVMKDLISHFSPALALQRQKRYLRGGGCTNPATPRSDISRDNANHKTRYSIW